MTARRSTGRESDRRVRSRQQTRGPRPLEVRAAIGKMRVKVTTVQLAGTLSASERRALDGLIATLAELLGEPVPD
jgi:hypothetical protein